MRNKNKENTRQRKTITRTRQYLRGSAICLHPQSCRNFTIIREKIQSATVQFFSLSKTTTTNPNHQNYVFYILHTRFTMGYKTGKKTFLRALPPDPQEACPWALRAQASKNLPLKSTQNYSSWVGLSTGSNTTRLHKAQQISNLETSSITNINRNPPKTIPHPCNSSSYSQARRPTETAHNFNFSIIHNNDRNAASFV